MGIGGGLVGGALMMQAIQQQQQQQQQQRQIEQQGNRPQPSARPQRQPPTAEELAARERAAAETRMIADIQTRLNALQFNAGKPDGQPGGQTKTAIRAFQASLGQPQTGTMTDDQYVMLKAATTPQPPTATAVAPQAPAPGLSSGSIASGGVTSGGVSSGTMTTGSLPAPAQAAPTQPLAAQPLAAQPPPAQPVSARAQPVAAGAAAPSATADGGMPNLDIFSVRPLDRASDARQRLKTAGFSTCRDAGSALVCSTTSDTVTDTVVVGLTSAQDAQVYAVMRTVRLKVAADRGSVLARMRERYALLVDAPDRLLASGEACRQAALPLLHGGLASIQQEISSGKAGAGTKALADACDSFSGMSLADGGTVDSVSIALFSGTPLRSQAEAVVASGSAAGNIRF